MRDNITDNHGQIQMITWNEIAVGFFIWTQPYENGPNQFGYSAFYCTTLLLQGEHTKYSHKKVLPSAFRENRNVGLNMGKRGRQSLLLLNSGLYYLKSKQNRIKLRLRALRHVERPARPARASLRHSLLISLIYCADFRSHVILQLTLHGRNYLQ